MCVRHKEPPTLLPEHLAEPLSEHVTLSCVAACLAQALLDDASQALRVTLDQMTTHMLSLHGLVNNLNEVVSAMGVPVQTRGLKTPCRVTIQDDSCSRAVTSVHPLARRAARCCALFRVACAVSKMYSHVFACVLWCVGAGARC